MDTNQDSKVAALAREWRRLDTENIADWRAWERSGRNDTGPERTRFVNSAMRAQSAVDALRKAIDAETSK